MENKETVVVEKTQQEKTYTQQDVDNIMEKVRAKERERIEKHFVSKVDYDAMLSEFNNLKKETKEKELKSIFATNGGKEAYYDDFIALNNDLLNIDSKDLGKTIQQRLLKHSWASVDIKDNQTPQLESDFMVKPKGGVDWAKEIKKLGGL